MADHAIHARRALQRALKTLAAGRVERAREYASLAIEAISIKAAHYEHDVGRMSVAVFAGSRSLPADLQPTFESELGDTLRLLYVVGENAPLLFQLADTRERLPDTLLTQAPVAAILAWPQGVPLDERTVDASALLRVAGVHLRTTLLALLRHFERHRVRDVELEIEQIRAEIAGSAETIETTVAAVTARHGAGMTYLTLSFEREPGELSLSEAFTNAATMFNVIKGSSRAVLLDKAGQMRLVAADHLLDMPPEDKSELLQPVVVDTAAVTLYLVQAPSAHAGTDRHELSELLTVHFRRPVTIETEAISMAAPPSPTLH